MKAGNFWLRVARLFTLVFMLFCLMIFIAGVFYYQDYFANHANELLIWEWTPDEMESIFGRIGLSFQWWVQWNLISAIVFAAFICGIGFFIFLQKNDDWFSLYVAASFVLFGTFTGYPVSALAGTFPALKPIITPLAVSAWLGLLLIFYAFPNGRFVPVWTRWVAVLLILSFAVNIIVYGGDSPPAPLALVMVFTLAIAPASQVYRYVKASNAFERQQTKWVLFALLLVFAFILLAFAGLFFPALTDPDSQMALVIAMASSSMNLVLGLIPLSVAFAILRYRLWDIDVIIRKTLVYGALTAMLALVFFGGVTLLQQVVGRVSETGDSPVAIVISTLLIAALFSPLRRRIQDFIDRRFYRRKYNAERALADFAATARNETDLEALTGKLVEVVSHTMQPEKVSVWLARTGRRP
jgi:cytochrome bd-type quinol oxidase subunit 2